MAKSKSSKKSKSRSTHRRAQSHLSVRPRTRRRSDDTDDDDEVRERIRRARYPPGAIDSWLSRVQFESPSADLDRSSCATPHKEGEVLCTVYLEYKEHPEIHKGFDDGGVYTLYLRLATPPISPEYSTSASLTSDHATSRLDARMQHPLGNENATLTTTNTNTNSPGLVTITLATYDGWNTCMDAPRWTTLDPNPDSKLVFWESREKVVEVLGRVAGEQEQAFIRQVAAMSLR